LISDDEEQVLTHPHATTSLFLQSLFLAFVPIKGGHETAGNSVPLNKRGIDPPFFKEGNEVPSSRLFGSSKPSRFYEKNIPLFPAISPVLPALEHNSTV
jgi:hypothetical protein